jgi:hypothetical protein
MSLAPPESDQAARNYEGVVQVGSLPGAHRRSLIIEG